MSLLIGGGFVRLVAGLFALALTAQASEGHQARVLVKDPREAVRPITFHKIECYEERSVVDPLGRVRIFLGRGEAQKERMEIVLPLDEAKEFSKADAGEVCLKVHDARFDERTFCTSKRDEKSSCRVRAVRVEDRLTVSLQCQNLPRTIVSENRLSFEIPETEPFSCQLQKNQ